MGLFQRSVWTLNNRSRTIDKSLAGLHAFICTSRRLVHHFGRSARLRPYFPVVPIRLPAILVRLYFDPPPAELALPGPLADHPPPPGISLDAADFGPLLVSLRVVQPDRSELGL